MRTFTKILLLGLTVFFAQIAVHAQTTGSLSGTITDQANAVVAGATVTLQSNIASGDRTAVTDSNGNCDVFVLPEANASRLCLAQQGVCLIRRRGKCVFAGFFRNSRTGVRQKFGLNPNF